MLESSPYLDKLTPFSEVQSFQRDTHNPQRKAAMAISFAPIASLSLLTGYSRRGTLSASCFPRTPTRASSVLRTSFLSVPSTSISFPSSSLAGLSLGVDLGPKKVISRKYRGLQVRAGKAVLCMTKRNRSRKSLARTHGFRRRMRTTSGRAVLKRRRAKGRKVLCTKSHPNSGK